MLPRQNRLTKRENPGSFLNKNINSQLFLARVFKNPSPTPPRFSIVVSKAVDSRSVVRNRLKRQTSEIIRKKIPALPHGLNIVLRVKKEAKEKPPKDLEVDLENLLARFL